MQLGSMFIINCNNSYHGGYEIDPYGSNGGALESDSTEPSDYGGGENGTL
jgi:hypothetical protein